ncbi:sensor histidine kinase [Bacteroides cellulosilyticus]|uniref:sensor histidine kinase n=1 Tax=Bacteroides cellulosilyticus TaxID=246787 RepID=UPI001C37B913|nr:HAMP domain-containing sensor histidine kinase [Bacteroides cellulosilyticus]MBV3636382.1 HAMP domain-containing histidine kinase [Bacteroides cellulosilyticus]MBV3662604.1 HAMP domain-containing histidine kinase [Bacteroides cellulosilyticus]MBV3684680.1 HAMP domain-containing histidine kinase [Bacteroides cellulosilyticus]MBV3693384.1 HAMP domain-containing histidine kinase [Bacteroides cellulosilyticus]MBV3706916.1 HAMP domain-containing histidine kinase [Bacteroides cellulosilyticus]
MGLFRKIIYSFFLFLLISIFGLSSAFAVTGEHPVLIISSYNPDARQTSGNIYDFMEEFERLGGKAPIALENMNCKSFSESPQWKSKMTEILDKYEGKRAPVLLVLIGQEAWAAYLSQEDSIRGRFPVLTSLASRNAIILPDDSVNLKTWMPGAVDFFNDFTDSSVKAGFVYEYDVEANINLIKHLYPNTKNIAFVSDNSYGGVSLQAHVVEEMKKHPELNLILLDGRTNTIYTISDKLHELPPNTALLMGTWRVDMYDGYFMRNATYTMMEAAGDVPTFSISSVGIGYWAIGGVTPSYRPLGKDMAYQAVRLLQGADSDRIEVEVIPNKVMMDSKIVKEKRLDLSFIHQPIEMVNENPSFYEQYKYHIWTVATILVVLSAGLFVSLYFYYHTKKLKDELQESESALRDAKDRAEESSRLKSAFLANMSHEIRTPLNAIVGFSDVLASGGSSEDEQQGYVDIIKTNSDLLLRLINDILDVSRLEADRVTFTFEECDVVPLCQRVLASVSQARKSENEFIFECDRESMDMRTDTQRLQQVIINLLSNADKFTRNGKITLGLKVDEKQREVLFSVSDTGTGIPLEKQKLVFERFEKLNEYVQGTGLGLSICKLTVEKWGGEIWVDPGYTDGARFVFTHPLDIEQPKK